jgi:7-cyano-7-deazaguanine synthase
MPEFDLIMLYSGGADSYLMLKFALQLGRKPYCILVDYGQKHIEELAYAKMQLEKELVKFQQVTISGLDIDSGLTGFNFPGIYEGVHPMNVPGRNTMFISIAYSIAESKGISEIWYGPDYSDFEHLFPDCYQSYVGAMNKVLEIAPVKPIKLYALLLGWTKEMVVEYLRVVFDIQLNEMHSGYEAPMKGDKR